MTTEHHLKLQLHRGDEVIFDYSHGQMLVFKPWALASQTCKFVILFGTLITLKNFVSTHLQKRAPWAAWPVTAAVVLSLVYSLFALG